jgi:hypothetical protein
LSRRRQPLIKEGSTQLSSAYRLRRYDYIWTCSLHGDTKLSNSHDWTCRVLCLLSSPNSHETSPTTEGGRLINQLLMIKTHAHTRTHFLYMWPYGCPNLKGFEFFYWCVHSGYVSATPFSESFWLFSLDKKNREY